MPEPSRPLDSCTILVAEDHPFVLETLVLMLEGAGATVVGVPNGQEALHRLREASFDLLITDIDMPGFDGLDLLGVIRRFPSWVDLPVIFLTSYADTDRVVRAARLGACAFLLKSSFDRESLFERVVEVLGTRVIGRRRSPAAGEARARHEAGDEPEDAPPGHTAVEVEAEDGPDPRHKSLREAMRNCNATESDLRDVIECLDGDPLVSQEFARFGNAALAGSGRAAAPRLRELVPRIGLTTTRIIITGMLARTLAGSGAGPPGPHSPIEWDDFILRCVQARAGVAGRVRTFLEEGSALLDRIGRADSIARSPATICTLAEAIHATATLVSASPLAAAAEALARRAATGSPESLGRLCDRLGRELDAALATAAIVARGLREAEA